MKTRFEKLKILFICMIIESAYFTISILSVKKNCPSARRNALWHFETILICISNRCIKIKNRI